MAGKRFFFLICFVSVLDSIGLLCPFPGTAGLAEIFFIRTEPVTLNSTGIRSSVTWRVEVTQTDATSSRISFFTDTDKSEIGHLTVNSAGHVEATTVIAQQNVFQGNGIFLVPGLSAPCNILPAAALAESCPSVLVESLEKTVCDQRFALQIELRCEPVDLPECVHQGWIRDGMNTTGPFQMISAVNQRSRQLMVRQLWHPGDDWWLYEETEFQKSWRMNTGN